MAQGSSPLIEKLIAVCQAAAGELGQCLTRTLDATITATFDGAALPGEASGVVAPAEPGLLVTARSGASTAILLLPESSGLIPPWCKAPDATGVSKLNTLAFEMTMLLPEADPGTCQTAYVDDLAIAFAAQPLPAGSVTVQVSLSSAEGRVVTAPIFFTLVAEASPAPAVAAQPAAKAPATPPSGGGARPATGAGGPATTTSAAKKPRAPTLGDLPRYSRSLLHISVPVVVRLASKKQPIATITELGPGSIIQFEKSCEEMLDLEVGNQTIGRGEAVKVGDKFGIRLTSIFLPEERFKPVRSTRGI